MYAIRSYYGLIKHVEDLSNSLKEHERAILALCFVYDNPGFRPPKTDIKTSKIGNAVNKAIKKGIEIWQINFEIDENGVKFFENFLKDRDSEKVINIVKRIRNITKNFDLDSYDKNLFALEDEIKLFDAYLKLKNIVITSYSIHYTKLYEF